ncbi:Cob(I)alamin adenosyltransferase [Candidatus Syntrophocurvum alkaliphilum]|uniref:Cob(I)alamin adenosyltransferase n=1 Tax=Candidatus Syntrophocurvum alkaliphilum TaxID=2293317 RepID=A0A6I6DC60_9FIRM|nr:cob(I)yrinic acid a,c-diamide adenosyltransferase [Candidatus Syntrophocurvum alkaliphilum]QGU00259.1 Cob(I)alamin adenosyltransferase [Candidatus Syntrophocurvum alkaliphilum]
MIHIYTGNGKGKTSAAFGVAIRARGHDFRVRVIQFLKGSTYTGELSSAEKLGIEVFQFGRTCPHAAVIKSGFLNCQKCGQCWIKLDKAETIDIEKTQMAWQLTLDTVTNGKHDLLILDEIMNAYNKNLIPLNDILKLLEVLPDNLDIILTGRNPPKELIEKADLVSNITEVKHPARIGVQAKRGLEY